MSGVGSYALHPVEVDALSRALQEGERVARFLLHDADFTAGALKQPQWVDLAALRAIELRHLLDAKHKVEKAMGVELS